MQCVINPCYIVSLFQCQECRPDPVLNCGDIFDIKVLMRGFVSRKKMIIITAFLPIAVLLSTVWLFVDFMETMRADTFANECGHADAIVALTGGSGRLKKALALLLSEKGDYLIISGVNKSSDIGSIFFVEFMEKKYVPHERVIMEKGSKSTYENALATKKIVEFRNFKSLILLTSGYHMRRALYTFRRVLPFDVAICAYPVYSPNFKLDNIWRDSRSFFILLSEFIKFYWYRLFLVT